MDENKLEKRSNGVMSNGNGGRTWSRLLLTVLVSFIVSVGSTMLSLGEYKGQSSEKIIQLERRMGLNEERGVDNRELLLRLDEKVTQLLQSVEEIKNDLRQHRDKER